MTRPVSQQPDHANAHPSMTSHLSWHRLHCQQHAMALDACSYDCCVLPPAPPLDCLDWSWGWGWDSELLHTHHYTLAGAAAAAGGAVQAEPTFFPPTATATPGVPSSPASSEASSGYLHDAVAHWSDRGSKRQRMAAATTTTTTPPPRRPATVSEDLQCLLAGFWDSSAEEGGATDFCHDLNATTTPEAEIRCSFVSGEEDGAGASGREEQQRGPSAQVQLPAPWPAAQGEEEEATAVVVTPLRFPATVRAAADTLQLQKAAAGARAPHAAARRDDRSRSPPIVDFCCRDHHPSSRAGAAAATTAPASACPSSLSGEEEGKKRGFEVLYPFTVVKPLGLDDGRMTTLDDVNRRILKRPARPVRHPVGPFACRPAVSAHGLGLSGKAVVSLTKIRTGGNGTITIIRTRG